MSSRFRVIVALTVAAGWLAWIQDSAIHAQVRQFPQRGNQRQQGQMRNLPQLDIQGTVDAMTSYALKVTTDSKQTWLLTVSGATMVEVKGKANVNTLAPGMYIAFSAEVNKKGPRIEEKVKQVSIFTPSNRMQVGAVPESAGLAGGMSGLNVGGDEPFGAGAKAAGKGAGKSSPKAASKASAKTSEFYEIKGQITSIKAGKITLKVPNEHFKSTLRFDLAEDAEVSVDIAGTLANCGPLTALVKPGDRVEVRGVLVAESRGNVSELKVAFGGATEEDPAAKAMGKEPKTRTKDDDAPAKPKKEAKKTAKSKDDEEK